MADAAIRIQEAFPGVGSYSQSDASATVESTFKKYVQSFGRLFRKSGAMENRMESYRYAVASRVPFHCEHI